MRRILALATCSLVLLAGCGGPGEVSTDDLEQEVGTQLGEQADLVLDTTVCEGPLPAEVDAEVRCEGTTEDGSRYGILVTATGVEDDGVAFDAEVDERLAIGPGELEPELSGELERQVGTAPKSVECEDPLPAEVDAEVRCVLTAPDDTRLGMTVTTTSADGTDLEYSLEVDDEPLP